MDTQYIFFIITLIVGLFLSLVGFLFFFVPTLLIKWNAVGNTWIGASRKPVHGLRLVRGLFSVNYALFSRPRVTGVILVALGLVLIGIYIFYS
jgi:hypothetical protein